ncbi:MAG: hypothetical protein ACTSQA_03015 [Candidatus Heimdallarchaeaceae archaeon]
MANVKKQLYNLAINGQGYLLYGVPTSPVRTMMESQVMGVFPSQFDEEYKDSSSFLPWVQTDWSGGFQSEKWEDDAKCKKSTGIDHISKYGEITLLNDKSATLKDFGAGFTFGASLEYDRDNVGLLIGITKTAGASQLWKMSSADVFTAITGGTWANINAVHDMDELQGKAYIGLTVSSGSPLKTYDGSAVADITLTGTLSSSTIIRMTKRIEDRLYVGGYTGTAANGDSLMYSDDEGTTWTAIITKTGKGRTIKQGTDNLGTLYFLIEDGGKTELWWCNDTIVTQIYRWNNLTDAKIKSWLGKIFIDGKQDGKLMRFSWNGAELKQVFEEKISELDVDISPSIIYKNNLHSYGLVYDGLFNFPSWVFKYSSNKIYPFAVFGSATTQVPYFYGLDSTNLKITKLNTSAYLTTGNTIGGIYTAKKPAVKKLWHSITLSFKELATGQTIIAAYSKDDEANWTTIGTVSPVTGETEKTFYYAEDTTSKRIQLRITLTGGGTNTPTLYDYVVRFLPLAEDKFAWNLSLNCQDNLMLLDGKTKETKRSSELRNLLRIADIKNEIVDFQDIDYAETAVNDGSGLTATNTTITVDSTADFPEQGRLKIEQEEILYTGKTATTFTGCTRQARGTVGATHADDTVVHNGYKVIISNVSEQNPVAPSSKITEAIVSVSLREV